jgi:hypothetical protein
MYTDCVPLQVSTESFLIEGWADIEIVVPVPTASGFTGSASRH